MMGTKHRTFVFETGGGMQIGVEIWDDGGVDVKIRPTSSAIWGLPLRKVGEEGEPVSFSFEEED